MQFFVSHLASWLRTRRFSEPTFRPSGAQNHWRKTVFRDFLTFSRICIFFLLTLLSSNLSLLSASSLLCFSSVHTVGSLTSKLPSIITTYYIIDTYYYGWFPHFLGGSQLCILTIIGNIILVESKIVSHFLCIYILYILYIIITQLVWFFNIYIYIPFSHLLLLLYTSYYGYIILLLLLSLLLLY